MDKTWLLEEAEGHLLELVRGAQTGEVQIITKAGEKAVAVVDYAQYLTLLKPKSLLAVLRGEPPYEDELQLVRDKDLSLGRELDLE